MARCRPSVDRLVVGQFCSWTKQKAARPKNVRFTVSVHRERPLQRPTVLWRHGFVEAAPSRPPLGGGGRGHVLIPTDPLPTVLPTCVSACGHSSKFQVF